MKKIKKRKLGIIFFTTALTLVLYVSILFASIFVVSGDSAGPLIQMTETDGFRVVWWDPQADEGMIRVTGPEGKERMFNADRDGYRFEAAAEGLEAGLNYSYEIFSINEQGNKSLWAEGNTKTAVSEGEPFTFTVFGDSGSGSSEQYELADLMSAYPSDFFIHVGDLVYPRGEAKQYSRKFFKPYEKILRSAPFYPVLGNHDMKTEEGRPFLDTFSFPDNGPAGLEQGRCYWFTYSNALFVGIDSTLDRDTLKDSVAPWLSEVLKSSEAMWKFVYFHHPPYSSGSGRSKVIKDVLVPVIEEGEVDVVFCGHVHQYERIGPVLQGEVNKSGGVLYIISGAGGKSLRSIKQLQPYTAAFYSLSYSFTHIEIDGQRLKLRQINQKDEVVDELVLEKSNRVSGALSGG